MTHKSETLIVAALDIAASLVASSLFASAVFVWLVIFKTGGM